jgi:hypothetical protein
VTPWSLQKGDAVDYFPVAHGYNLAFLHLFLPILKHCLSYEIPPFRSEDVGFDPPYAMVGSAPGTSESPWVPESTNGQFDLSSGLLDTRLIDAADQPSFNPLEVVVSLNKRNLWKNLIAVKGLIITFLVWLIFTILYSLFVYYVLLNGQVQVGTARFDASTANLLVSIFSQIFVVLADTSIRGLLSALRLALALNNGTGLTLFLGVSPSTDWFPTLKLFALAWLPSLWGRWTYSIWGNGSLLGFRLSLPIIGLAFASGLKCTSP